jgi:hypothetical protein
MMAQLTFRQFERCYGKYNRRSVRTAGNMLAIATMTLDHHHWLRAALVTDISTITTADDWELNGGRNSSAPINWLAKGF